MLANETLKASGTLHIVVTDHAGNIKEEQKITNLVVTVGKEFVASRMIGVASNVMSHLAIGTGTTAAVVGNTTLENELTRVALASSLASSNTVIYSAGFGLGVGTGAITEAGIFNAASSGTMLCRTVFSVINKGILDSMVITWTITIS
ncbi:hypothetical protein UFOVP285_12 [uncultured Caudovirales phage]|uniref:Uncharacterized protein n=1 Tax=uncultured Caudovirales phage TaxID=2100421 RepID=A0A6J5LLG1_9CAUD|nr:hypothetical protein UFOVP285_12 [uncultured Caudovirales phage]